MNRLVTIIIICAFVLASVLFAISGTEIYKMNVESETSRTLCETSEYFTDIIRECKDTSAVRTASIGGKIPALILRADRSNSSGEIWYFVYNGYLKKLLICEGQSVSPEKGTDIMSMNYADFSFVTDELLDIYYELPNGEKTSVKICLPDRKGDK